MYIRVCSVVAAAIGRSLKSIKEDIQIVIVVIQGLTGDERFEQSFLNTPEFNLQGDRAARVPRPFLHSVKVPDHPMTWVADEQHGPSEPEQHHSE